MNKHACDWVAFHIDLRQLSQSTVTLMFNIEANRYDKEPTKYCLANMRVSTRQGMRPTDCSGI